MGDLNWSDTDSSDGDLLEKLDTAQLRGWKDSFLELKQTQGLLQRSVQCEEAFAFCHVECTGAVSANVPTRFSSSRLLVKRQQLTPAFLVKSFIYRIVYLIRHGRRRPLICPAACWPRRTPPSPGAPS